MLEQALGLKWIARGWSTNRIVGLYALIGSAWILLSDRLVVFNAPDAETLALLSMGKGLGYVVVTGAILRWLINRYTAELRESAERFHLMFERHDAVMLLIEPESGRIVDANLAAERYYGYPRAVLTDMAIQDINALPIEEIDKRRQQAILGTTRLFVFPHRLASGEIRTVEVDSSPITIGQQSLLFSIVHDITERKRAEEELRRSQAFNQALINHSPLGISIRNRTGQLLFANAAWRKIWAIPESEIDADMSRDRDTLTFNARDEYFKPYQAEVRRVYEQGGDLHLPELKTLAPRPGAAEWITQYFYAIVDDHGQVDRVVVLTQDITDRKQAEQALRESEARFRAIAETSNDGILFGDANAQISYRSPSYQRINGYANEERVGQVGFDTVHPDDLERVRQYWVDILQHPDTTHKTEYRIRHKDGTWRWIETSGQNLLDNPNVRRVVVASRDITDRKQRERELQAIAATAMALRAANTRDEMIPVIVQQIYSLLNADGAALIVPDAATGEAIIVYSQGIGTESSGLRIPPGAGIVGHVIATGRPYLTQAAEHDPYVFRPDLASELHALLCAPLIAHSQIIGVLWVGKRTAIADEEARLLTAISDIAANALYRVEVLETLEQRVYDRTRELAQANEQLKELDRLKSKFVSDVSHELRTPITSLMLNVELLEHGKPEKREHYLSVIRQQTTRQVQLIEDILNLSRLELSAAKVQFAPVNVNALIEQAVNVYHSSAEAANLTLHFTPDPNQPIVSGVESHLSQVVTNLIANAISYTPAGSVEVRTQLDDNEVLIEVCDTGLGIAPEDMPHLFDRFYRGKLTWQVRGSGLGLSIVKEITEVHHGRVEVISQAGVGSTFRVYLPVASQS